MPLPTARDLDAVDAGPLPHTTANAIQDAIVDHEARLDAAESPPPLLIPASAAGVGTLDNSGREVSAPGGQYIVFPVPLRAGDTVTQIKVFYKHSLAPASVDVVDWSLGENEADGTPPVAKIAGDDLDGTSSAWTSATAAGSALLAEGNSYSVEFFNVSGTLTIAHIEVTFSRIP